MTYMKLLLILVLCYSFALLLTNLLKFRMSDGITPENEDMVHNSIKIGLIAMAISGLALGIVYFV